MLDVISLSEICEVFREILRLRGLSEMVTLNFESFNWD